MLEFDITLGLAVPLGSPLTMQAPGWLPFRVRQFWDTSRIDWALRKLNGTRPRAASVPESADVEVHMLLCRRDVRIGVLALKSLLRFEEPRLAVTLTSDGSLTEQDRHWIDEHIPGCRWLARQESDPRLQAFLAEHPNVASLYRGSYHPICNLLHPTLLARTKKILVVDPDAAFFGRPDRWVDWVKCDAPRAWYLHDHQDEATNVPAEVREAFAEIASRYSPQGRSWKMDYYFFNSGLLAFRPEQCDLNLAERYEEWRIAAAPRYLQGKPGLWFGDWTPEQTAYQIMFALMDPPAQPLGDDYHLGGDRGHAFNHFMRYYLVKDTSLKMLADLVENLN